MIILYIEDQPSHVTLVKKMLRIRPDITLLSSESGEEGVKLCIEKLPDIVLMDIGLPGMDGFQALDALKSDKLTAHIPVVAVTANAIPDTVARDHFARFEDFIIKPVNLTGLLHVIDSQQRPAES